MVALGNIQRIYAKPSISSIGDVATECNEYDLLLMIRFVSMLYGSAAVFLGLLTGVFFWKLGPRDLTPWVALLASVNFASHCIERLKKLSERVNQLFTAVLLSWTFFLMFDVWRGRGTGQNDALFPIILIAFICMLLGMLLIRLGLRLRSR